MVFKKLAWNDMKLVFFLVVAWIYCIYLIDECQRVVTKIGFQEISLKRLETTFFCGSCMYLLYIFHRWVSLVAIYIGFLEISMKSLETTFFCGSCMNLLYIFDRWLSRVVIDIGFKEISLKTIETTFFEVVACIYFIYLIDESH